MNIYIVPHLWTDDYDGKPTKPNYFILLKRGNTVMHLYTWQRVIKIFPGIWRSIGGPFMDYKTLLREVKRRK